MTRPICQHWQIPLVLVSGCASAPPFGYDETACDAGRHTRPYFPLDEARTWVYAASDRDSPQRWIATLYPERRRVPLIGRWVYEVSWSNDCGGAPECDPDWYRTTEWSAEPGEAVTLHRWDERGYPLYRLRTEILAACMRDDTYSEQPMDWNIVVDGELIQVNSQSPHALPEFHTQCPATDVTDVGDCLRVSYQWSVPFPIPSEIWFARGVGPTAFTDPTGSYVLVETEGL